MREDVSVDTSGTTISCNTMRLKRRKHLQEREYQDEGIQSQYAHEQGTDTRDSTPKSMDEHVCTRSTGKTKRLPVVMLAGR